MAWPSVDIMVDNWYKQYQKHATVHRGVAAFDRIFQGFLSSLDEL